jgi:hypothetical protein
MVLGEEHPAHVKEKISTRGRCTIGELLVLKENAVGECGKRGNGDDCYCQSAWSRREERE